ncbi:hypothetical protein AK830_g8243 [Neonectria ditissima]|uniref:PD-(D/E)XK nuclease-like domain-containing protein n=1 Tax=Neonectria ditissima TaxID=78410 RepID=A0A0N8H692_9HYPO|nr:hypothetical protein AK830_g8243 [Neonectria ditissima]
MHSDRVLDWLDSVPAPSTDDHYDGYDPDVSERPRKRARLNKDDGRRLRLPTPSRSASPLLSIPTFKADGIPSMPPKHPRNPDNNDDALQMELTPRPLRRSAAAANLDSDTSSLPPSTPSRASSKASKLSRNSSPRKQLRNAKLKETGFLRASLLDDQKPTLLHALTEDLTKIGDGFGILPKDLQSELAVHRSIRDWNFGDAPEFGTTRLPDLKTVQRIYKLAKRCFTNNHPESSWNNDVHSRVLDWVLRDGPCEDDMVDYRCCLSAQIIADYQPISAPSKMVDYCICIEPDENSPEYDAIESLCEQRPGMSINHTEWADLTTYPIAISIETKGPSIGYETALLQVATWHSAQWRSLRWDNPEPASSMKLEFLPGIIVMQHHWWFVATALNEDGKARTFERLLLGETESILGIYKLSMTLQKLVAWARDQHWPAFQTDMGL